MDTTTTGRLPERVRDASCRLTRTGTRFAKALRDIGLTAGETPARCGYPVSVFCALPCLFERAGNNDHGSITGFYTVLLEEDGDPVGAEVRSLLDGHVNLSRKSPTS